MLEINDGRFAIINQMKQETDKGRKSTRNKDTEEEDKKKKREWKDLKLTEEV